MGWLTRRLPRACAVAVVVALHAVLVCLLVFFLRSLPTTSSAQELAATLIFLREPPAVSNAASVSRLKAIRQSEPAAAGAITLLPPSPKAQSQGGTVDWDSEMRRAAAAATAKPQYRDFRLPRAPSWLAPGHSSSHHEGGEQYRLETGEWVVWVSDRCFIIAEPRPLGVPDVFARSAPTRMACN